MEPSGAGPADFDQPSADGGIGVPAPELPAVDCAVGFAFGTAGTNEGLAFAIEHWAAAQPAGRGRPPMFLQWEIADCLQGDMEADEASELVVARPLPGEYLSTVGVLNQFASVWGERGFRRVAVCAQRDHLGRCISLVEGIGFEAVPVSDDCVNWSQYRCDDYGYDMRSQQPWTRVRWRFLVWNNIASCFVGSCCVLRKERPYVPVHRQRTDDEQHS